MLRKRTKECRDSRGWASVTCSQATPLPDARNGLRFVCLLWILGGRQVPKATTLGHRTPLYPIDYRTGDDPRTIRNPRNARMSLWYLSARRSTGYLSQQERASAVDKQVLPERHKMVKGTTIQRLTLMIVIAGLFVGLASQAHAQQSVEEFLQPHTKMQALIDNYGPPEGSPNNPAVPYKRVCTQSDAQTISCRTFIPKLPSGGGKWFGPWYWVAPDPAPAGYRFQSASFSLPMLDQNGKRVAGPDWCYGNDNSPMQRCDPEVGCGKYRGGNPDTSWMGHKIGADHGFAVCYIPREDANGPKWLYNLQGQEGGVSVVTWPFAKDNNLTSGFD
jgi:hypothetical protein